MKARDLGIWPTDYHNHKIQDGGHAYGRGFNSGMGDPCYANNNNNHLR